MPVEMMAIMAVLLVGVLAYLLMIRDKYAPRYR